MPDQHGCQRTRWTFVVLLPVLWSSAASAGGRPRPCDPIGSLCLVDPLLPHKAPTGPCSSAQPATASLPSEVSFSHLAGQRTPNRLAQAAGRQLRDLHRQPRAALPVRPLRRQRSADLHGRTDGRRILEVRIPNRLRGHVRLQRRAPLFAAGGRRPHLPVRRRRHAALPPSGRRPAASGK